MCARILFWLSEGIDDANNYQVPGLHAALLFTSVGCLVSFHAFIKTDKIPFHHVVKGNPRVAAVDVHSAVFATRNQKKNNSRSIR